MSVVCPFAGEKAILIVLADNSARASHPRLAIATARSELVAGWETWRNHHALLLNPTYHARLQMQPSVKQEALPKKTNPSEMPCIDSSVELISEQKTESIVYDFH